MPDSEINGRVLFCPFQRLLFHRSNRFTCHEPQAPLTPSTSRLSGPLVSEAFSRLHLFAGANIASLTRFT
jgi:hypothetical protein